MSKKCKGSLVWFIVGMVVQVIAQILAKQTYMLHPVLFCIAAGFLILVAIGAGMVVAEKDKTEQKPMSYMDYAEEIK